MGKQVDIAVLDSLADKYEDILEPRLKVLYTEIVNYIAVSQVPLVHVNAVLDLIKQDLLKQLSAGYFPESK